MTTTSLHLSEIGEFELQIIGTTLGRDRRKNQDQNPFLIKIFSPSLFLPSPVEICEFKNHNQNN